MDPNFIKENKVKLIVLGVILLGCVYFFFFFGKSDPKPTIVAKPPTAEENKEKEVQIQQRVEAAKKSPPKGS